MKTNEFVIATLSLLFGLFVLVPLLVVGMSYEIIYLLKLFS